MRASIALGAELDVVTPGELGAALDPMHRKLDLLGRRRQPVPIHDVVVPTAAPAMPAAGAGVVWFLGPSLGQVWNVTGVTWFAGDDHTPVASSTVAIYKGTAVAQMGGQLLLPGGAAVVVPGFFYPPRLGWWLHPNEALVIAFYGPAAGTALGATLLVDKYMAADVEPSRIPW